MPVVPLALICALLKSVKSFAAIKVMLLLKPLALACVFALASFAAVDV